MLERERRIADVVAALGAFPTRTGGPASLPSMADEEQCSCASLEGHVFDLEELRDRLTSPALQVVEQDGTFYLVSSTFDGMVRVDGDLDPETGQTLIAAIASVGDRDARSGRDERTATQRRADALGEICRGWLDRLDRPVVAGERPHVVVTMDLASLEARAGGSGRLGRNGSIGGETARRLACDASVARVLTAGPSEPLDVGRRTSVVSSAMRRALIVRDEGCAFPECDRPPAWTDAHHVRHWAHGGPTAVTNLVLLCRPHYRRVHGGEFVVSIMDGGPRFARADGSELAGRAPP